MFPLVWIAGAFPKKVAVTPPTPPANIFNLGTYTYNVNRLGLTWENADPAAEIRIYRNDVLINTLPAGSTDLQTGDILPWDGWDGVAYKNGVEATTGKQRFDA